MMRDTFRKFRYCYYVYIGIILSAAFYGFSFPLLNLEPINDSNTSHIIVFIFAITFLIAWFLFLLNLSKLATAAKKSATLWVIGAWFFNIVGMTVAYYRMKAIAIRNGWI
jgi:hypothetical protein